MSWLIEPVAVGYPAEYLVARLRGRGRKMLTDWRGFTAGTRPFAEHWAEGRDSFASVTHWCFGQMERPLRKLFSPLLFAVECRTVILCLRFIEAGDFPAVEPLLQRSLLGTEVRRILLSEAAFVKTLSDLASVLASGDRHFAALPEIAGRDAKLPRFEQHLLTGALNRLGASVLPPLMRQCVRYLIDWRNLLAVAKFLRWQEEKRPVLAEGGLVPPRKLDRAESTASVMRLARMSGYGLEENMRADRLEIELARFFSGKLRVHRLSDDGRTQIFLFLWQAYLEQRNRTLLLEGRHLESALLREELVY